MLLICVQLKGGRQESQRELFYSFSETIRSIIRLNIRFCCPKKSPLLSGFISLLPSKHYYINLKINKSINSSLYTDTNPTHSIDNWEDSSLINLVDTIDMAK